VAWDVYGKYLVVDAGARFFGARRMDNDSANVQPFIPRQAVVDLRIGGEYQNLFWSLALHNLFDTKYFDYAVASAFTLGRYNAYPLPGRTVMARAGVTW
jgi:iron complex outermembrane recepter protein